MADLKRSCNGRYASLMHLIATDQVGVKLADGWVRIVGDKAAAAAGIQPNSVRSELNQMVKRGTLELVDLRERDYNVRVTAAGWQMLAAEGVIG